MTTAFRILQWLFVAAVALSPLFIAYVMIQHGATLELPELPPVRQARIPIPTWAVVGAHILIFGAALFGIAGTWVLDRLNRKNEN